MKKKIILMLLLVPFFAKAQPCAVIDSTFKFDVLCNADTTGFLYVFASATAGPVTYELNPGAIPSTTGYFPSLSAGIYTITATDANLCSVTSIYTITEPTAMTFVNLTTINVSCFGGSNGSIQSLVSGGTPPYNYTLMPSSITNTLGSFNNLSAGTYTITATDANNCVVNSIINISQPPTGTMTIDSTTATAASCVPGMDGSLTIHATGSGPTPFSYSIATTQASSTFNNMNGGTYWVSVADANGCSAATFGTVPNNFPNMTATLQNSNPCNLDSVLVSSTGGTPPYTYNTFPAGPIFNTPGNYYTNLSPGFLQLWVTDAGGCVDSSFVNVIVANPVLDTSYFSHPNCNQSDGNITASVSWGTNSVTYILNPGAITNSTGVFNNLPAGNYTLSAQISGCSTSVVMNTYTLAGQLIVNPITSNSNSFTGSVPSNGTPPFTYMINSTSIPTPQSGLRCTGIDTFTISDANGCMFDTVFSFVSGNAFPSIQLNKNITPSSCALTNDGQILYAPSAPLTFDWVANASVFGSTLNNLMNLVSDTYIAKITDAAGNCIEDTSVVGAIGTNCGNIIGQAFIDSNTNCLLDGNEFLLSNVTVTLDPGNLQRVTNANGEYQFLGLGYGNYTISVDTNTVLNQYPICNNVVLDTLTATNVLDTINFPFALNIQEDLFCLSIPVPKVPAAPIYSWTKTQRFSYGRNLNSFSPINATVYAVMDSIKHYHSAIPSPSSISGDTLIWNVANVPYFSNVYVYFDSLQALNIGDSIPFKCWIEPNTTIVGNNLPNDTSCIDLPIVTSYDPNDKAVEPKGIGTPGYIELTDKTLSYLVRFQNTGTAMAYNIHIEDTLSSKLDLESFRVISSSHPYQIKRSNNAFDFIFKNIMLPDSNSDEANSHGYILYQIDQNASNQLGDIIENTAHIYFDFNPAIVTNTTLNTIGLPLSVNQVANQNNVIVYPNPTEGVIYIQSTDNQSINSIKLFDMMGRPINIKQRQLAENKYEVEFLGDIAKGNYILKTNQSTIKITIR